MKLRWMIALVLLARIVWADPVSSFDEGLLRYRANDMSGAIAAWERVMHEGVVSGPLLYNLGNAHYRQGEIARAILCYERARKLLPRDRDVRNNLDIAKLATVDKLEAPVHLFVWDWLNAVRDYFSASELARLFEILGILTVVLLIVRRLRAALLPRILRAAAVTAVCIWMLAGSWYLWRASLDSRIFGIVLTSKTDVYSAPDSASTQLFSVHEGTKVRMGERLSEWVNVRLPDGRSGWLPRADVERI
jgi:hypothetical protein